MVDINWSYSMFSNPQIASYWFLLPLFTDDMYNWESYHWGWVVYQQPVEFPKTVAYCYQCKFSHHKNFNMKRYLLIHVTIYTGNALQWVLEIHPWKAIGLLTMFSFFVTDMTLVTCNGIPWNWDDISLRMISNRRGDMKAAYALRLYHERMSWGPFTSLE